MITIKLGFLMGLPLAHRESSEDMKTSQSSVKQSPKLRGKEKSKNSSISAKTMNRKKAPKTITELHESTLSLPNYAFKVDKPKGFFHIEYKLFPHLEPCHIDILHWGEISKIFLQNKFVIYKNKIEANIIWIPIMIEHKVTKKLSREDLFSLKTTTIEFIISSNKKKMGLNAKNEKVKKFFIRSADLNSNCYVAAFQNDPNTDGTGFTTEETCDMNFKEPLISVIKQFDYDFLHPRFQKIISKLASGEEVTCKQFQWPKPNEDKYETNRFDEEDAEIYKWPKLKPVNVKDSARSKNIDTTKKSVKSEKTKKAKTDTVKTIKSQTEAKIYVPGECYLTDAPNCTCRLTETIDDLIDFFVVFSTTNLTQLDKLNDLKPIVIKLKSIRNLPLEHLKENKYCINININNGENHQQRQCFSFNSVYLRYNIPNIAQHVTRPILLTGVRHPKIKIHESQVFFDVPLPELSYLVSLDRLIVELIGIYNEDAELELSLYGSQKCDFVKIPTRPSNIVHERPKIAILAVACYDLSLLMHSMNNLVLVEPLHHPSNCLSQAESAQMTNSPFTQNVSIEQIHLKNCLDYFPSPLFDGILSEFQSTLKIQVCLGFTLNYVHADDSILYKRLFLIIYDVELACLLASILLQCNGQFQKNVFLPNYSMYAEKLAYFKEIDPKGHIVTGFWIDNDTSVIMFLEGCRQNFCLEMIFQLIRGSNESLCRFYYNSEICFYTRIYEHFLHFGGVYKITLKYKLLEIFKVQWTYLKHCIPKLAFEAIQKLQTLIEMQSLRDISQHALLPTVNELLSFNMEFGVPHLMNNLYSL